MSARDGTAIGGAQGTAEDQARLNAIKSLEMQRADATCESGDDCRGALAQARKDLDAAYTTREYGMPNERVLVRRHQRRRQARFPAEPGSGEDQSRRSAHPGRANP